MKDNHLLYINLFLFVLIYHNLNNPYDKSLYPLYQVLLYLYHYLDIKDSLYKKCYHSCERCDKEGNDLLHNCLICNNNFPVEIKINNSLNCYEKCNFNYYFDNESNYQCKNDLSCPEGYYPSSIQGKNECIKGYIKHESTHIIIKEFPTTELEKTIINKSPSQIISNQIKIS